MKNRTFIFASFFVFLICFSCVENGIVFPKSETDAAFEVTIDGVLFSTDKVDYVSDGETVFINAIKPATNEIFTIKISDFGLKTNNFDGTNYIATYIKNNATSADIWSTFSANPLQGQVSIVNIDAFNNTISGTFNFVGEHSNSSIKNFANGSFTDIPKKVLQASTDNFSAKVDGVTYNDISLFGNLVIIGSKELILISANKSSSEKINISLNSDIAAGEYDFGSFITQTYPTAQYNINGETYVAEGKINIISHDKTNQIISGTFNFEASPLTSATPNFSITEGVFSVSY